MRSAKEVGKVIGSLSKQQGVSINKLLEDIKLSKKVVDNMNTGSMPAADKLLKIAEYLNVTVEYLLKGDENTGKHLDENEVAPTSVQEAALLGAFRVLPAEGREVALKQVIALGEAFSIEEEKKGYIAQDSAVG